MGKIEKSVKLLRGKVGGRKRVKLVKRRGFKKRGGQKRGVSKKGLKGCRAGTLFLPVWEMRVVNNSENSGVQV